MPLTLTGRAPRHLRTCLSDCATSNNWKWGGGGPCIRRHPPLMILDPKILDALVIQYSTYPPPSPVPRTTTRVPTPSLQTGEYFMLILCKTLNTVFQEMDLSLTPDKLHNTILSNMDTNYSPKLSSAWASSPTPTNNFSVSLLPVSPLQP